MARADSGSPSHSRGKQNRRKALCGVHLAFAAAGLTGEGKRPMGLHDLRHSFIALPLSHGVILPEAAMLCRRPVLKLRAEQEARRVAGLLGQSNVIREVG